jgi:hypothetical protein
MKRIRRGAIIGGVLIGLVLTVLFVGHAYLASRRGAARVAARLGATYGLPVQMDGVDVGWRGTSLRGVRLFEAAGARPDTPWLRAERVDTDISAWGLVRGRTAAKRLRIVGGSLALHFDEAGRLTTRFPTSGGDGAELPELTVECSQVTICQQGRPDMVVIGVDAELRPGAVALVLTGAVSDPYWGAWTFEAQVARDQDLATALLKTASVQASQEKLTRLPFVNPALWRQVRIEGLLGVEVALRSDPAASAMHYRVTLDPRAASLDVAAIDLHAEQLKGRAIIEDGRVDLAAMRGRAADGDVCVSGTLDFREQTDRFDLTLNLARLDVRRLPSRWGLPTWLEGRLRARSDLHIALTEGKTLSIGIGEGTINDARLGGVPARPITLAICGAASPIIHPMNANMPNVGAMLSRPFADVLLKSSQNGAAKACHPARNDARCGDHLEAHLALAGADLSSLLPGLGLRPAFPVMGPLTAEVVVRIPLDSPQDLKTYRMGGIAKASRLAIAGIDLERAVASFRVSGGKLWVQSAGVDLAGSPAAASGQLELTAPYRYQARVDLRGMDLGAMQRLAAELRPAVPLEGRFSGDGTVWGTVQPLCVRGAGVGRGDRLKLEGLDINELTFQWSSDGDRLDLTDLRTEWYGGQFAGSATVPLSPAAVGDLDLRFQGLDLGAVAAAYSTVPLDLNGRASGTISGSITAARANKPRDFTARIELGAPRLTVQNFPTERFQGSLTYGQRSLAYNLHGELFDGRFQIDGRLPLATGAASALEEGKLTIERVRVARLAEAAGGRGQLADLRGLVDSELRYSRSGEPSRTLVGEGRVTIRRLGWAASEPEGTIAAAIRLKGSELLLRNLTGTLAGGSVRGQSALNLKYFDRSWYNVAVDHAETARLTSAWPALATRIDGPADVHLRGRIGRDWRGSGSVTLARGKVLGVEVSDWRLPFDYSVTPGTSQARINVWETSAMAAHGRIVGQGNLTWGTSTRLEGNVRFTGVELSPLLRSASLRVEPGGSQIGGGRATGHVVFSADALRSMDDVNASLEASFTQPQAQDMPVLRQLVPFLARGRSGSTSFQSGDVRARLANGVVRLQRLALKGTSLQLMLEGTATLEGRVNLEATAAAAGLGQSTGATQLLGLRLPALGPIPMALLVEATTALANRLVHLRVSGTVRNPTIHVEPLSLLTEEAARLFLGR